MRVQCVRRSCMQRPDASTRGAKQFPRESGTSWCTTTLAPADAGRHDVPRRRHACLNTPALCVVPGACPCHSVCLAARRKRHVSRSHGSARGRKDDYKRAQQRRYSSCGSRSSGGAGEQCALLRCASGGQAPCTLARDHAVARDAARFLLPHPWVVTFYLCGQCRSIGAEGEASCCHAPAAQPAPATCPVTPAPARLNRRAYCSGWRRARRHVRPLPGRAG